MPPDAVAPALTGAQGLNWHWIAIQSTGAPVLALLLAVPFWRKAEMIFGNIVGSCLVLGWAIVLILLEYIEVDRSVQACIDAGTTCWPEPSAFARFAIYASIGMAEVFLIFTISLAVERRISNRNYAPEWRR
jgi:hypothetical protein